MMVATLSIVTMQLLTFVITQVNITTANDILAGICHTFTEIITTYSSAHSPVCRAGSSRGHHHSCQTLMAQNW